MDMFHTEAIKDILTYASINNIELNEELSTEIKDEMLENIFNSFLKFNSQEIVDYYTENENNYLYILEIVKKHNTFVHLYYTDPPNVYMNINYTKPDTVCEAYWYMVGDNLLSDDYDYICELYSERY